MAYTLENRVGRLVEASIAGGMSLEDTQSFRTRMFLTLSKITGRAVLVGDLRECDLFSPEVGERLVSMLKTDNPKVERTAFLVREGRFASQIETLIGDATQAALASGRPPPPRRSFRDPIAARDWLSEVLDAGERTRLFEYFRNLD